MGDLLLLMDAYVQSELCCETSKTKRNLIQTEKTHGGLIEGMEIATLFEIPSDCGRMFEVAYILASLRRRKYCNGHR